jgi:Cohesin domain/FlgD Ig-like domain
MAKRRVLMLCVLLAIFGISFPRLASAADSYEVVAEYDGATFHVVNAPTYDQLIENPTIEVPFNNPGGVAVAIEAGGRIMNYVLDSGNKRILGFEANMDMMHHTTFTYNAGGPAAPSEYNPTTLWTAEYTAGASQWIIPYSQIVKIDGVTWTYLDNIGGKASTDLVYTIDWTGTNGPIITFPAGSLSATSSIELAYAVTDYNGGGTAVFGLGDFDQGNRDAAATAQAVAITETAPSAMSFQDLTDIFTLIDETSSTADEIWVLDSNDGSTGQDEFLQVYKVTAIGAAAAVGVESFVEAYDDGLSSPSQVFVASGPTRVAATIGGDFADWTNTDVVVDENQVTGHTYDVNMTGGNVVITDLTTERVVVASHAKGNFAGGNNCNLIPGYEFTWDAAVADDTDGTITTIRQVPARYAFVADKGNDRIKVISVGNIGTTAGDDLPGDARTSVDQAGATVGDTADQDYYFTTPATPGSDWRTGTVARPLKEGSITLIEDPDGTPVNWSSVADIRTADPTDKVYQVDWWEGQIVFGDGTHGEIPTGATDWKLTYTTTPDVMRYGTTGSGDGQFSNPQGVCAVWNANIGAFNVYVADTGNNRIQKFRFSVEDQALGMPYQMEYVCEWDTGLTASDYLAGPTVLDVETDGTDTFVGVVDFGNNRVIIYKDSHVDDMTSTVPIFETVIGGTGNSLGTYNYISDLELVKNGTELEIYITDSNRGVVTKYVKAPSPSITLSYSSGTSLLPKSFPPTGSYPFRFTTTNAPDNGWVDLYYSVAATYAAGTGILCFTSGTISSTDSPSAWVFTSTPSGLPADGSYYIHAVLRDGNGTQMASSSSDALHLLTLDSNLVPAVQAVDAFDSDEARGHSDRVLLMGPTSHEHIILQLSYPDSVTSVFFEGTFPVEIMDIVQITPIGGHWDGAEGTAGPFDTDIDHIAGTFSAATSVLHSPIGLTYSGNVAMFDIEVMPKDVLTPTTRVFSGAVTLSSTASSISTIHNTQLTGWITRDLTVWLAYVGDNANTTTGTGSSELPYLEPNPDGYIDYADLVAFVAGWNGEGPYQDAIADIDVIAGGTAPDLAPNRDGAWDVNDMQALTTNWSWFDANVASGGGGGQTFANDARTFTPLGEAVSGQTNIVLDSDLTMPVPGREFRVDVRVNDADQLMAALVRMAYDPTELRLVGIDNGEMLGRNDANVLNHTIQRDGLIELNMGRLSPGSPGVDGDGVLATMTFEIITPPQSGLGVGFDLRDAANQVLARGTDNLGVFGSSNVNRVMLFQNYPNPLNPTTNIVFALPTRTTVDLGIFDLTGRRIATLISGPTDPGVHMMEWSGRDRNGHDMPSGVYFYKLRAGNDTETRKLVITR